MKIYQLFAVLVSSIMLVSCAGNGPLTAETSAAKTGEPGMSKTNKVLFEDSMAENWQENWFLDGKKATVEHRDGGLYFSGGTITKKMDREKYHAHHAVLWTKKVFEGDLMVTFKMKRVDKSDYGNTLLYIQAQGTGTAPYDKDISKWNKLREVPNMSIYFTHMSLLSLSFRKELRCRRYPLRKSDGTPWKGDLSPSFKPYADYGGIIPDKTYLVEVVKKNPHYTARLFDAKTKQLVKEHTWDVSKNPKEQMPRLVEKGRIGLRHMSTKQFIYWNFKVTQL